MFYLKFILMLHCVCLSLALPIFHEGSTQDKVEYSDSQIAGITISYISSLCLITLVVSCLCCKRKPHIKVSSISAQVDRLTRRSGGNSETFGQNGSQFPSGDISVIPLSSLSSGQSWSSSQVIFEPLPDANSLSLNRIQAISPSQSVSQNNENWYVEPFRNFPRNQLQYVRKLGSGWFGQVLEGRAVGIDTDHTSTVIPNNSFTKEEKNSTPVVVKVLKEDASPTQQTYFLQELLPYKELDHPHILKLLAYCIETQPFLILLQHCPKGNLKEFIKHESPSPESLLQMCGDVVNGLSHMHQHDYIHTDLAARNCLVEVNNAVKIGDYGYNVELYQEEYYLAENVALPIRWCAPETLQCTENTIEILQLTNAANVWSLGVLLWEIFSNGELPYKDLDDDGVIREVILGKSRVLGSPLNAAVHSTKLSRILSHCLMPAEQRPDIDHIQTGIKSLINNCDSSSNVSEASAFDERWQLLRAQNSPQSHNIAVSIASDMKFESDFTCGDSVDCKAPLSSDGSIDCLDERISETFGSSFPSWLGLEPGQPLDSLTEEISKAIHRLDEALAEERSNDCSLTSSTDRVSDPTTAGSEEYSRNKESLSQGSSEIMSFLDTEEARLTQRLEKGDFSELVRLKSQSVQDFMRLTVVDDGSDSDKASQPGSIGDYCCLGLAQDKTYSSESNLKEAVRDARFMDELEQLHNEHKYSIISEVSREGNSLDCEVCETDEFDVKSASICVEERSHLGGEEERHSDQAISKYHSSDSVISSTLPDIYHQAIESPLSFYKREDDEDLSLQKSSSDGALNQTKDSIIALNREEYSRPLSSQVSPPFEILQKNLVPFQFENSKFMFEKVVEGEDVVFGALDDYSLQPYKSVKKNCQSYAIAEEKPVFSHESLDELKQDPYQNQAFSFPPHEDANNSDALEASEIFLMEANRNIVANRLDDNNEPTNGNQPMPSEVSGAIDDISSILNSGIKPPEVESPCGIFWQQQMTAWQEAADQTRELFQKASHSNSFEKMLSLSDDQDSEEGLGDCKNPETPTSPFSQSTFLSGDRITSEDETTYVSYEAPEEHEPARYSPEDIDALRLELNLRLDSSNDPPSPPRGDEYEENVVINYRAQMPIALSPIKEESLSGDFEFVNGHSGSSVHSEENSSIEFIEYDQTKEFFPEQETRPDVDISNLSPTEARNSLILEDLENNESSLTRAIGATENEDRADDFLIVDTETNLATLINSDRPSAHPAFLHERKDYNALKVGGEDLFAESDDVASESRPYRDTDARAQFHLALRPQSPSLSQSPERPRFHPYFSSGLSSFSQPLTSLEDASLYDSEEHISLPYDVNYDYDSVMRTESENEALILDDFSNEDSNSGKQSQGLSFIGSFYNEDSNSPKEMSLLRSKEEETLHQEKEICTKEEDIDEELPLPTDSSAANEETPSRTPSKLENFIWREQSSPFVPERSYTPDWESEEEPDDLDSSSCSGEFVWQVGDATMTPSKCQTDPELRHDITDASDDACTEDSESGEEEFIPSTWNRELTPQRSLLLKNLETSFPRKKRVHWKRQKHHRIYEYPPEPQSWHVEPTNQSSRRSWGAHSVDYLTLAGLELGDFAFEESSDFDDTRLSEQPRTLPPFYAFPSAVYQDSVDGLLGSENDFFLRPSENDFRFRRSSFSASEFFPPGGSRAIPLDLMVGEEGPSDPPPTEITPSDSETLDSTDERETPPQLQEGDNSVRDGTSCALGELKHVKEKLRLDIPSLSLEKLPEES